MLMPADTELIKRDSSLMGLTYLLDETKLLVLFQKGFPEKSYSHLKLLYIRYKPQTSCLVRVELESKEGLEQAFATAHQSENKDKFIKADLAPPELCSIFGELGIILQRFPYDRKLKPLTKLLNENQRPELLQKPLGDALGETKLHALVYKPERRFVARLETESQTYALKLYSKDSFKQAQANTQWLKTLADLPIAQGCGSSEKYQLIAFDWLEGKTLRELFAENKASPDILYQLGQVLAKLHAQNASGFIARERLAEKERLEALGTWLSWLLPDLAQDLYHLSHYLGKEFLTSPHLQALVHGDFYDKQVLVHQETIGLIDFDEAYQGDPAHDIGLFIAHLERNMLINRLSPQQFDQSLPAFLKGYESISRLPERISLYTATELIGLAPHFFRNRQPDWPYYTRKLIFRAADLVKESYLLSA